jgi:hypothetical protein
MVMCKLLKILHRNINNIKLCHICGSHGSDCEEYCLQGCHSLQYFRRNILTEHMLRNQSGRRETVLYTLCRKDPLLSSDSVNRGRC